jgi:hypothetical protein
MSCFQERNRLLKIVQYTLQVQNLTLAPDGIPRQVLAVNGQIPGPTIEASTLETPYTPNLR